MMMRSSTGGDPRRVIRTTLLLLPLMLSFPAVASAQNGGVPTPGDEFGFDLGDDYQLATYTQLVGYWQKLATASDRMVLDTIGLTEEGRPQLMAIITSPENHRNLDRYRDISRRLALADGITEAEARRLAAEGKAVIWIDGGLHATEVLGAQQLMRLVYDMVRLEDDETMRFLDDIILLAVHANPDGHELVADWYMREPDPLQRSSSNIPRLYEKYAGHDNNRDFYMSNLAETTNMNRAMYREWYPQIVYNHHQTGPAGTIMFAPPFRDPPNHYLDPLIITSLDQVGSAMHGRMVQEGKGGTTMRSGAGYSTWWNGGLRTTPYFKNMIGLLTETIGHPTPMEVPFIPGRQLPHGDLPLPVEPGPWHFIQSVEYSQTANRAVLDHASRNRDRLLFNIWRMGMNSIERGRQDTWTVLPGEIDQAREVLPVREGRFGASQRGTREDYDRLLRRPDDRDARGYVIPSDQADFPTATKFVNSLLKNGVAVHTATSDFRAGGKTYPAGSYVVRADQAFRPFVLDMFEPQNHPNDFAYPGGPPIAPYDNAGWTLAYQMDVEFDRMLDAFDGPFEPIADLAEAPAGMISGEGNDGFLMSHEVNDAFTVINRLMAQGRKVYWMTEPVEVAGQRWPAGMFYLENHRRTRQIVEQAAQELGVDFTRVDDNPAGPALELRPVRIGLWDRYGGSMPSGWTRFILERFEFPFEVVYPPDLDAGDLHRRFDVLLFPDGGISQGQSFRMDDDDRARIPMDLQARLGTVTAETTVPQIEDFLRRGGTVVTIGTSTSLGSMLGLPLSNHLVDSSTGEPLAGEQYYVPGSVLELKLEHVSPITHGLGDRLRVLFSRSPVFDIEGDPTDVRRIGWFDTADPLRSGWAWGQERLENGTTLIEADVGDGKLYLFGPKVTFRAQAHGSYPLVFNSIYYGKARERTLR